MRDPDRDCVGRHRHRGIRGTHTTTFRQAPIALQFYADTDHTGSVNETEQEWRLRQEKPGAVVVYNCDRDGATSPRLDYQDTRIVNAAELSDFTKLVVKRNTGLPSDCEAFIKLSDTDARKLRGFNDHAVGASAVIGKLSSRVRTEWQMTDIRTRDYIFAFEAVKPVNNSGEETVEIHIVIKRSGSEVFNDFVYFTIAPWLMLSNFEEVESVYVARVPYFYDHTGHNLRFISDLQGILGSRLHVIRHGTHLNRWMQDVIEIGFSSTPATHAAPMHQFMNSRNAGAAWDTTRVRLFRRIKHDLIGSNFGHIRFPTPSRRSLDSFGNLEITPPFEGYPFGRIFYGVRETSYSRGHRGDEMGSNVVNFLQANKYQPPVEIPTSWLNVGHVDEFLSFVPNMNARPSDKPYKLLVASPREAIRLCRQLQRDGRGNEVICRGKGTGYAIRIDRLFRSGSHLLRRNRAIQRLIDRVVIDIIRNQFDLPAVGPDGDIIEIPTLFNAILGGGGRVNDALARTGGMVNCLVVKPDVIIPKPFGPKNAAGVDVFESDVRAKLSRLGLSVHFVNDWRSYHVMSGEIHCGTNAKRRPPVGWEWWNRSLTIGGNRVHS